MTRELLKEQKHKHRFTLHRRARRGGFSMGGQPSLRGFVPSRVLRNGKLAGLWWQVLCWSRLYARRER